MIGRDATFLKPLQPTQCWPDALLICLAACLNLEQTAMVEAGKKKNPTSISSLHRVSNSAERMYVI